jgi:predicted transcriptional regulator
MPDDARPGPVSVRVPPELLEKLDKIAATLERSRSWVLLHAFQEYLKGEGDEILGIHEGLEASARGETYDSEEVMAEMRAIVAAAEAKRSGR